MQQVSNSVLSWVNWTKVFCLFMVYFAHTESRSDFFVGTLDYFYKPFYVNAFFILSGYLIFKKQLKHQVKTLNSNTWYKQFGASYLKNLLFRIAIPTVLFGAIGFIPKMLMRGQNLDWSLFINQSIGGCAFWFTSALTIAELLLFCIFIFRIVNPYIVFLFSIIITLIAYWLSLSGVEKFPWYYQSGMCAMIFISTGGIYFDIEKKMAYPKCQIINNEFVFLLGLVFYLIICLYYPPIKISGVKISFLGYFNAVLSSIILIHYMTKLPKNRAIDRIGGHTLGMYFLSGAIPEILCYATQKIIVIDSIAVFIITIISFGIGVVLNELLVKYLPFLFDLRMQSKKMY